MYAYIKGTIEEIAECYVEGTRAYDEDEVAKEEITELNKIIYALAELGEEKCQERLELEMVAEDFGRSTAEIAQMLGITLHAVKKRMQRGRERLKLTLGEEEPSSAHV